MIKKINYISYRKLKNLNIEFEKNINVIAGTNGTCKTSILHTISNSFKAVSSTDERFINKQSVSIIKHLNKLYNPKIETLTRGDKEFNDPSQGNKGTLYVTTYTDDSTLSFRKHNSKTSNKMRFAVKPQYKSGENESLPAIPTIYLGLFRLFSYGEFESDELIRNISDKLPPVFQEVISNIYKSFTGYEIEFEQIKDMGRIKNRPEFKTNISGIDSNTISAGEDNLFIILTALVSLRYYYESINSTNDVESILLIDEIDASLHPEFQLKLIKLFVEYSEKYKIQIFFTTHSMSLIEYTLKNKKCKTIYLLDQITNIKSMVDPDKYKIDMLLKNAIRQETYLYNKIPIITEDIEARFLLKLLIDFYPKFHIDEISIEKFFHIVDASISSEAIYKLASDEYLLKSTMRTINILDGDQFNKKDFKKNLIVLPGATSPEKLAFTHANALYDDEYSEFWDNDVLIDLGFTKRNFNVTIKPKIESIGRDLQLLKNEGTSTKGVERSKNKKLFNEYKLFWEFVLKNWIENESNRQTINTFYNDLRTLFLKTSEFHGINSKEWHANL